MDGLVMPSATGREPDTLVGLTGSGMGWDVLDQGYQLFARSVNFVVHHRHVELRLCRELLLRGLEPALPLLWRLGAAADQAAHQLLPRGRGQEHEQGLGHRLPHLTGALEVDLEQGGTPGGQRILHRFAWCAISRTLVHHRPLEQLAGRDELVELLVAHEPVVAAVALSRAGLAGRRRDRDPDLGVVLADVGGDRALADRGRSGEDGEPAAARGAGTILLGDSSGHGTRHLAEPNSRSRAAIWLAPRPRTLRLSEMLSRSIIWRARTFPTPGIDWSRSRTRIFAITSFSWPCLRTSTSDAPECFRRFFTSARSRREAAALSSAALRCSGVSGGRATVMSSSVGCRDSGAASTDR